MRVTIHDIDRMGVVAEGGPSGAVAAMPRPPAPTPHPAVAGRWLWLFPAVFAVHIAEEGLAGEGFYRWIRRVAGREVAPATFVAVNLAFEAAMIAAVHRATRRDDALWVAPALGLIGATNGLGHLAGSIATGALARRRVGRRPLGAAGRGRAGTLAPRPAPTRLATRHHDRPAHLRVAHAARPVGEPQVGGTHYSAPLGQTLKMQIVQPSTPEQLRRSSAACCASGSTTW